MCFVPENRDSTSLADSSPESYSPREELIPPDGVVPRQEAFTPDFFCYTARP